MVQILTCVATDGGADASTDAGPRDPVCALIGSRCHPYDDHDGGVGHQCHEIGHANDPVTCAARQVECLAACGYAPAMLLNNDFHELLTPESVAKLIDELSSKG